MIQLLDLCRRPQPRLVLISLFSFVAVLWWVPPLALALGLTMFGCTLLLCVGRLACLSFAPPTQPPRRRSDDDEFVSIHIATYSEPPEVVIETLDKLSALTSTQYEVIVLDNNTPDPRLYLPVEEHCRKLGRRFRFYHFDQVEGAKAGALNISLRLADPKTSKILLLDADYHAEPDILEKGLSYFVDSQVALVQFPQAYRNSRPDCGLTWEYRHFFDVYMNRANLLNTVLSTGTAAFVCKDALLKSGGWSGETLTEDAELGLRFHRHGYRGVYVPEVVAAGLMPTDLAALKAQRRRWVLGNAQSLGALCKEPNLSWTRKAMMLLQLTAWANPLLLAFSMLLGATMIAHLTGSLAAALVASLASATVLVYLFSTWLFFTLAVRHHGGSVSSGTRAFLVHLGLLWEGAVCPGELFVRGDKSFVRTSKFIRAPESFSLVFALVLSLVCGSLGFNVLWNSGCPWCAFVFNVVAMVFGGKAFLQWNLHAVRAHTLAQRRNGAPAPLAEPPVWNPKASSAVRLEGAGTVTLR